MANKTAPALSLRDGDRKELERLVGSVRASAGAAGCVSPRIVGGLFMRLPGRGWWCSRR